ncbi:MAG: DUF3310 domain-containing protein [Acinetobacter sp.]
MNYKIEVKSKEQADEAEKMAATLGYEMDTVFSNKWSDKYCYLLLCKDMSAGFGCESMASGDEPMSMTELRALVFLHKNPINMDKVLSGVRSDAFGLFEDKPIKEYLNKLTDGTYKLVVLSDVIDGHDGLIEIPEGADIYAISKNWKENIFFAKSGGDTLETFNTINKNDWHQESTLTLENLENNYSILWQRHTQPEELPFIDDEPLKVINSEYSKDGNSVTHTVSLNNQYAEIEQVRKEYKSNHAGSDLPDFLIKDTVNHPSHYASGEIECIDAIESSMTHEAFCGYLKGNVQKYMWRYENKGGITDLEKAQWYLNKLISRVG